LNGSLGSSWISARTFVRTPDRMTVRSTGPRLDRVVHHAGMIVIQFCVQFAGRCPRQEPTGRVLVAGPEPADDRVLDLCMNLTARGGAHPNDLARWSPAVTTPEPEGGASLLRKGLVRETHRCPCCSHRLKLSEA